MSLMPRGLRPLLASLIAVALVAMAAPAAAKKKKPGKAAAPAATAPIPLVPSVEAPRGAVDPSQLLGARRAAPGAAAAPAPAPTRAGGREAVQRESHIEFDERLVQGQTASGAIYLFQRGESDFRSMVRLPSSFRDRTVREVLGPSSSAAPVGKP